MNCSQAPLFVSTSLFNFQMKTLLLSALGIVSLLSGCVNEHHYHPVEPVPTTTTTKRYKAAPSVREESAGEFRAVERPSTYSQ